MKRNKARHLDYFVDGKLLIPALFCSYEEMEQLIDAAFEGILIYKTRQRRRGA